jgi:hypothetical protein
MDKEALYHITQSFLEFLRTKTTYEELMDVVDYSKQPAVLSYLQLVPSAHLSKVQSFMMESILKKLDELDLYRINSTLHVFTNHLPITEGHLSFYFGLLIKTLSHVERYLFALITYTENRDIYEQNPNALMAWKSIPNLAQICAGILAHSSSARKTIVQQTQFSRPISMFLQTFFNPQTSL